jgi:hypothetical protein
MRGHGKIIEARMAGQKPPFVFINDYPCKTDWFECHDHATVSTHGDAIHNLDFRFLINLKVSISASTEERAKALFERIKDAGAAVVAACHVQPHLHPEEQSGWAFVWRKEVQHG